MKTRRSSTNKLRRLVFMALLVALTIVLERLLSFAPFGIPYLRIGLKNVPIMLASIWFGPLAGAAVGASADIIGANFFSATGWFAPLTIAPILTGVLPWVFMKMGLYGSRIKLFLALFLTDLIASIFVGSFVLHHLFAGAYALTQILFARAAVYLMMAVFETLILSALEKRGLKEMLK